jgi:hypothetical protein
MEKSFKEGYDSKRCSDDDNRLYTHVKPGYYTYLLGLLLDAVRMEI